MFIGHFASGLGFYSMVKKNKLILFLLVLGTQVLDLLWGQFTLLGIEGGITGGSVSDNMYDVPWSHSLLMSVVWSIIYALIVLVIIQNRHIERGRIPYIAGLTVFSHWILDLIVHNNDMLLSPFGETKVPTLDLWGTPILSLLVETLILVVGWYIFYTKVKVPTEKNFRLWSLLVIYFLILVVGYLPSFSNGEASEVSPSFGIVTIVFITILAWVPYYVHPSID